MGQWTTLIFPQLLLSFHIIRLEFFHAHRSWSCFQPRTTNTTATTTEQNKQKNFNIPSFEQESIKSIQFLNKIPQLPFQASISASLKIIQRWTISYKCKSSPEFLGKQAVQRRASNPTCSSCTGAHISTGDHFPGLTSNTCLGPAAPLHA